MPLCSLLTAAYCRRSFPIADDAPAEPDLTGVRPLRWVWLFLADGSARKTPPDSACYAGSGNKVATDAQPRRTKRATDIPIDHWHFHRQLLHRYRIVLAPGDFSAIVASIRDGRARLIERQANGRAVYSVRVPSVGDRVFVLVSGARNVVTVLRPTGRLKGMRNA